MSQVDDDTRDMLFVHGTKAFTLKPSSIVGTAKKDLMIRDGEIEDDFADYAFHWSHVRKATSVSDLIRRAINDLNTGRNCKKHWTRVLYDNEDVLLRALVLSEEDSS